MLRISIELMIAGALAAGLCVGPVLASPPDGTPATRPKHPPIPNTKNSKAGLATAAKGRATIGSMGLIKTPQEVGPEYDKAVNQALQPALNAYHRAVQLYDADDLAGAEQAAQDSMVFAVGVPKNLNPECQCLIGRIPLKQGRYAEALSWLQAGHGSGLRTDIDLDMALCYSRLGNVRAARALYSDETMLRFTPAKVEDLPGTATPQLLEASILLARGFRESLTPETSRRQQALLDFEAAGKLAPQNGLIAVYTGHELVELQRPAEALPYLRLAARSTTGEIQQWARRLVYDYSRFGGQSAASSSGHAAH